MASEDLYVSVMRNIFLLEDLMGEMVERVVMLFLLVKKIYQHYIIYVNHHDVFLLVVATMDLERR